MCHTLFDREVGGAIGVVNRWGSGGSTGLKNELTGVFSYLLTPGRSLFTRGFRTFCLNFHVFGRHADIHLAVILHRKMIVLFNIC